MRTPQVHLASICIVILAFTVMAVANAAPRAARSLLTVAEVSAIVGAPVIVLGLGTFEPTKRGDLTFSNCSYRASNNVRRVAKVTLIWGPKAKLTDTYTFYMKRHKEVPGLRGDVLLLAMVADIGEIGGAVYDLPASKKLLDAALQKL